MLPTPVCFPDVERKNALKVQNIVNFVVKLWSSAHLSAHEKTKNFMPTTEPRKQNKKITSDGTQKNHSRVGNNNTVAK